MDGLYIRLQNHPVDSLRYGLAPYRQLTGLPLVVWEFNSLPGYDPVNPAREDVDPHETERFRRLAGGCDLAVCVSERLAVYARDVLGIRNTLVAPNGSDPDLFRPDAQPLAGLERDPGVIRVVWMGSADLRWHNFYLLEEAAARLDNPTRVPRIEFHVIGAYHPDSKHTRPNLVIHGPQPYDTLPGWLAAMDIGLVLSQPGPYDYNSPLKLFDYLSSGLAVIGTEQPQLREVFSRLHQEDLIIRPGDADGLAQAIAGLAADPARMNSLARAGRQAVIQHYNWDRAVRDTFDAIQELRQPRSGATISPVRRRI
jgi:glycosyltransferase involved in cell wall biosynthesis